MTIEQLQIISKTMKAQVKNFIDEDQDKLRTLTSFLKLVEKENIDLKEQELQAVCTKLKNYIYGQTYLDMLCVLSASGEKIDYELCDKYISCTTCSLDDKEYRKIISELISKYGDCNGFFSEEYIDMKIQREKEKYFSISVSEYLKKGGSLSKLSAILEKSGIEEFSMDTKIYANNIM